MISVRSNISVVSQSILKQSSSALKDSQKHLKTVATDVLALLKPRIHEDGLAADGSAIGTYSKEYLKIRTGAYRNNVATKGKNKGEKKKGTAGVKSKGPNVGKPRPTYHWPADPKIIVALTRQLQNDWAVLATPRGWGIGFNNPCQRTKN